MDTLCTLSTRCVKDLHDVVSDYQVPEGTPVFTPGTELAEEFPELQPGSNKGANEVVMGKKHPGSFADTPLDDILKKSGLKKVVLVGYMAHVCVGTTARQAAQRGYDVIIPGDAIGDRDIPGATGEEVTKVRCGCGKCSLLTLCQMVLAELGDAFGTIIQSKEVQ